MPGIESYRPSGRFALVSIPVGLLGGLAAALGLGWVYQLGVDTVPVIYVNFVLTAAFGAGVGYAVGYAVKLGRCRNAAVAATVAALCAVTGDLVTFRFAYERQTAQAYEEIRERVAEAGWEELLSDLEPAQARERKAALSSLESLRADFEFPDFLEARVESGWKVGGGRFGLPVSGFLVWLIWLGELGIVVVLAVIVAQIPVEQPFCERCGRWERRRSLGTVDSVDSGELGAASKLGDLGSLLVPARRAGSATTARYAVHACPGCDARHLQVRLRRARKVRRGEPEIEQTEIARYVRVTPVQVKLLTEHLADLRPGRAGR